MSTANQMPSPPPGFDLSPEELDAFMDQVMADESVPRVLEEMTPEQLEAFEQACRVIDLDIELRSLREQLVEQQSESVAQRVTIAMLRRQLTDEQLRNAGLEAFLRVLPPLPNPD